LRLRTNLRSFMDIKFIQKNDKKRYTLGIVYEPDVVDSQGDYTTADEIELVCWKFNRKLQGNSQLTKSALSILDAIIKADDKVTLDITDIYEDISKGAGLNDMHVNTEFDNNLGDVVESYIAPADFVVDRQVVKAGTWLMGVIWNEDYFTKVENGDRNGFSMEGKGKRE